MSKGVAGERYSAILLLRQYWNTFRVVWAARHELVGPKRLADELAFLPAALSLQETPVHPAPRRTAIAICVIFASALLWSVFGELDIVATAAGKIIVSERSKILQPLETSIIRRVLVKDGDRVEAGQILVELDSTNADADAANVQEQLKSVSADEQRAIALIEALQTGHYKKSIETDDEGTQFVAEWRDIQAKRGKLDAESERRQAEIATVRELIAKFDATLPMARQRESDFKSLVDQGFMSGHSAQDRQRERIEQERDLATQKARLDEARAALTEVERSKTAFLAETQKNLSDRIAQARLKKLQLTQEQSKNVQRGRLTQLAAPVAGIVQQVNVHTNGGVVTPAQALMTIIPRDPRITAEVMIDNKDIGFVTAGQVARIKLETFPFIRYGTLDARVTTVTADAVIDERRGAIFPAILNLDSRSIVVDGKRISLAPGMNITAEIKTGRRVAIDYLFGPIKKAVSEGLHER